MLGSKHRSRLSKQYLTARAQRFMMPRIAVFLSLLLILVIFGGLTLFLPSAGYTFLPMAVFFSVWLCGRRLLVKRPLGRYRGKVCPVCWRRSSNPKPSCPGCYPPAGVEAHRFYWRMMRASFPFAEQSFSDRFLDDECRAPMTMAMRVFVALIIAVPVLLILWIVIRTIFFFDLGWMNTGYHSWIWMVGLPGGILIAYYGKRRAGASNHCAKCEYQLAPMGEQPECCPECGNDLNAPNAIAVGRRVGSRWPIMIIVGFFALFVVMPFMSLFDGSMFSPKRLVPTDMVIKHVVTEEDPDWDVWRMLEARNLDNRQVADLLVELDARINTHTGSERDRPAWCWRVAEVVVAEANRRQLPHDLELQMLHLYKRHGHYALHDIHQWVNDASNRGVFSQAELNAAEQLTPIKRTTTEEHLEQVFSSSEVDWEVVEELEHRSLNEKQVVQLIDELQRRINERQRLRDIGELWQWGSQVGDIVAAQVNRLSFAHDQKIRLLNIHARDPASLPYGLKRWVQDAIRAGVFSQQELEKAYPHGVPRWF